MLVAIIDGSLDGLLTLVYARYYDKLKPDAIVERHSYQERLDAEYADVPTDPHKAKRVYDALCKTSQEAAENVWYAFSHTDESRFMQIFRYIQLVFTKGAAADSYLQADYVRRVIELRRYAGLEAHRLNQFIRFSQTAAGVLYSEIEPVCDVLYAVALHFADRLISERWVIHDIRRGKAAIYDTNELAIAETAGVAEYELCAGEERYEALWRQFVTSIAIKERINPRLQKQFLPTRFRPHMTEFVLPRRSRGTEKEQVNDNTHLPRAVIESVPKD